MRDSLQEYWCCLGAIDGRWESVIVDTDVILPALAPLGFLSRAYIKRLEISNLNSQH